MAATPVLMPRLGQAMTEGTIVEWHVPDGAHIEKGAVLLTAETDKATYDLEAAASGTLRILVAAGEEVAVDTLIGEIAGAGETAVIVPTAAVADPAPTPARSPDAPAALRRDGTRVLASPRARRVAAELGVDLATLTATAADGVICVADVERAHAGGRAGTVSSTTASQALGGLHRTMARRMLQAWQTIPHIVQLIDVDAGALNAARASPGARAAGITLNDLLLHAAGRVLVDCPALNAHVEDERLVAHDGIHVGLAVDSPRGLVVPVIRHVDTLSVAEVAAERDRLVEAARSGRLAAADVGGASLTVSNLGAFGITAGTPVINPGESCLVFVGTVADRGVVRDGNVVVRPMMTLSIAYDHRVVDGAAAARYSSALRRALEAPAQPAVPPAAATDASASRELRATSQGTGYAVDVRAARHAWTLDEPLADGGTDRGPDPVTALLGALLSCMTITFKTIARRRGVAIERVSGRVSGNPSGRLSEIDLALEICSPAAETDLQAILERAERGCYVSRALSPQITLRTTLTVQAPAG